MPQAAVEPLTVAFAREPASPALFGELMPLLTKHYREIAHYQDIPLDPDFEQYLKMEQIGMLRAFTARRDKELVGYAIFFIRPNLHYRTSVQALQDVLFIEPSRRGFGRAFIEWCDEQLKADGAQIVYHHVKAAHDFGPMLRRIGYQLMDLVYARRLDACRP